MAEYEISGPNFQTAEEYMQYNDLLLEEYLLKKMGFFELCDIQQLTNWIRKK